MTQQESPLPTLLDGWENYQNLIIKAIAPLTAEQLVLKAAPHLRSIHDIATHIVGARTRWFNYLLGEGDEEFAAFAPWDRRDSPTRSASELVHGLTATWQVARSAMERWTPADFDHTYPGEPPEEPEFISRAWV